MGSKLQVTPTKLQVTLAKLQVTPTKLQVTLTKLQVTSTKLQVTRSKLTSFTAETNKLYNFLKRCFKCTVNGSLQMVVFMYDFHQLHLAYFFFLLVVCIIIMPDLLQDRHIPFLI